MSLLFSTKEAVYPQYSLLLVQIVFPSSASYKAFLFSDFISRDPDLMKLIYSQIFFHLRPQSIWVSPLLPFVQLKKMIGACS